MSIIVKVVRVPGLVQDVGLSDGATVADALTAANTQVEANEALKLNGADATSSTALSDGDRIIIGKGATGNA